MSDLGHLAVYVLRRATVSESGHLDLPPSATVPTMMQTVGETSGTTTAVKFLTDSAGTVLLPEMVALPQLNPCPSYHFHKLPVIDLLSHIVSKFSAGA